MFAYTTVANVLERPEGVQIASLFIAAILVTSLVSRISRSTELRVRGVELDTTAERYVQEASRGAIRLIAHEPDERSAAEYRRKEEEQRASNSIPAGEPVLFLEVTVSDSSEFAPLLTIRGEEVDGYRVLRAESATVPNAIAAFLLYLRDRTGQIPHAYFAWTEAGRWSS